MKKKSDLRWFVIIASSLTFLSISIYSLQILLFHRESETSFYFFQDLSFVPIQVLFVTFVIDRLLQRKEKIALLKKINVSIGIFFSEAGNELISHLIKITPDADFLRSKLDINTSWSLKDFERAERRISKKGVTVEFNPESMLELKKFITGKKFFILDLLENSNIDEHDSFTDTLLATSHLIEELNLREGFNNHPKADIDHLKADIKRVYNSIIHEWILYMSHIKSEYPFLYSLSVRTNPFKEKTSAVIYN
ncbi:MAG TPA: hypothetical protein PK358_13070 [Spirochaetota bacterium]|nr:hypothetical protein [Spirochaetota bacterium]HPJ35761.1 hypothetical protein [Spirochaetota bacterium]